MSDQAPSQFDERFRLPPRTGANPGVEKRRQVVIDQQLRKQAEIPQRPANIDWFQQWLIRPDEPSRPRIGYFCNMVPVELITALGGTPVRLGCGNAAMVQPGEEVLAGDVCPVAKASFANLLDEGSEASSCQAFIVPTSCDAKRKLGEVLQDYRPTFMLNLPPEQDPQRYVKATAEELDRLTAFLEQQLRQKWQKKALKAAVALTRQRTALIRELQELRWRKPAGLSVRDFFVIVQASFFGVDLASWGEQTRQVIAELQAWEPTGRRARRQKPRLVLTGAPLIWPNFKVLNLIEECGAEVVADTLCSGAQAVFDPVVWDESGRKSLHRALALRYVFASACPCFVSGSRRLDRVIDLVRTAPADGVINYGLRLCQLFDLEAYRMAKVLREESIPFHNLRTDYSLEDTEQLRVRLEAFLETVEEA